MSRGVTIMLWAVAVMGAVGVLVAPLTTAPLPVVAVGLVICLVASAALIVGFVRH
jgi:hypothetical protein